MKVWLSPVASALVGLWSRKKTEVFVPPVGSVMRFVIVSGSEFGKLINPHPS